MPSDDSDTVRQALFTSKPDFAERFAECESETPVPVDEFLSVLREGDAERRSMVYLPFGRRARKARPRWWFYRKTEMTSPWWRPLVSISGDEYGRRTVSVVVPLRGVLVIALGRARVDPYDQGGES